MIQDYRTAISGPIKLSTGLGVGQDLLLHNLLKSFLRERLTALQPVPGWDLSFFLSSLVKEPFEPLSEISLKLLTFKTVFLALLATCCRMGEIHAIDYSTLSHSPNRTIVVLHPVPGFISTTQLRTKGASALESITIPSFGHPSSRDLAEDRDLCLGRCLKVYLARMKPFRKGKRLFFILYQRTKPQTSWKTPWVRVLFHLVCLTPTRTRLPCLVDSLTPFKPWQLPQPFLVKLSWMRYKLLFEEPTTFSEF